MRNIICITGPEASGKSELAIALSKHYEGVFVREYAREFLEKLNRAYTLDDVLHMAEMQWQMEKNAILTSAKTIVLDTDLSVFSVWIEEKYGKKISWIEDALSTPGDKKYLLCATDLPWQADPLREHPKLEDRQRLFEKYIRLLEEKKCKYHIVSGQGDLRIKNALSGLLIIK